MSRAPVSLALLLALLLAGCGGSTAATPVGTPAVTLHVTASNLAFEQKSLTVPANVTFAIELDNKDAAPHNITISGPGVSRTTDPFSGPQARTYVFAALPAGTYKFACAIHPEMTGILESSALSQVP
jgi:plastocyanin